MKEFFTNGNQSNRIDQFAKDYIDPIQRTKTLLDKNDLKKLRGDTTLYQGNNMPGYSARQTDPIPHENKRNLKMNEKLLARIEY